MIKPDYRFSSLPLAQPFMQSPYKDWADLATTTQEWESLLVLFRGMPSGWLEWVDEQADRAGSRGVVIREPLNYRLALLWNSMILLQEAKFICDWMEHALRQALLNHLHESKVRLNVLRPTLPHDIELDNLWKRLDAVVSYREWSFTEFENTRTPHHVEWVLDLDNDIFQLEAKLVNAFTFYILTETMNRNWKRFKGVDLAPKGFQQVFRSDRYCRSADQFSQDMKKVRTMRNIIAHSKRLLAKHEVTELFEIVCRWLKPLDVDLNTRIIDYRLHRPRFLDELGIK